MILLFKFLIAHLIGDFFLQPKAWVKAKDKNKLKSLKLYFHVAIHTALLIILVWDTSLWLPILIISLSHFVVDTIKLYLQKKKTKRIWFFIDQLLHLLIIFVVYFTLVNQSIELNNILNESYLLLVFCLLFLTLPVSIIMKTIFSKWNIEKLTKGNESLKDAGQYIGILERILVFIFIISDHWEAVGFLITAKSVFRFGDLKESKDRQLTEYILIGTLISFGIAIITGIIFNTII